MGRDVIRRFTLKPTKIAIRRLLQVVVVVLLLTVGSVLLAVLHPIARSPFSDGGRASRLQTAATTNPWVKSPFNPIFDRGPPGSWDQDAINQVGVIVEGSVYKMWYGGCTGSL